MKVLLKPDERILCNLFERVGLFEAMRGARYDHETFRAGEKSVGCSIHFDNRLIVSTNNQQRRRHDRREIGFGQIGPAARDTTARIDEGSRPAACKAALAPVLAPK